MNFSLSAIEGLNADSWEDAQQCMGEIDWYLVTHEYEEALSLLRSSRLFFQNSSLPEINLLFNGMIGFIDRLYFVVKVVANLHVTLTPRPFSPSSLYSTSLYNFYDQGMGWRGRRFSVFHLSFNFTFPSAQPGFAEGMGWAEMNITDESLTAKPPLAGDGRRLWRQKPPAAGSLGRSPS